MQKDTTPKALEPFTLDEERTLVDKLDTLSVAALQSYIVSARAALGSKALAATWRPRIEFGANHAELALVKAQAAAARDHHLQVARTHDAVGLAGSHQLHDVDLRTAHLDGDVQAVLLVDAGGHRLVEAAVLGLGIPVGHVGELFLGLGAGGKGQTERGGQEGACGESFHGDLLK